jgi:D-alanyl-lipoteichoic acid acyltransferase DltB (MBOAT superfamily)
MAIGMALMFGLKLPFNFNKPYCSTSISEFWRRWHMTLSRFLRDYIYIPLGGNRRGMGRQCCNLLITMGLGGLWHGAGWTFIAWGGMHGSALAIGHLWKSLNRPLPKLVGWLLTIIFVIVAWVFFRAPDFRTAANVLTGMTGLHGLGHQHIRDAIIFWGAIVIALVGPASQTVALQKLKPSPIYAIIAALALVALIFLIGGRIPDPFIYFQF